MTGSADGSGGRGRRTLLGQQLGRELRRLRERAGLGQDEAAGAVGLPGELVGRVERGAAQIAEVDLVALLRRYGLGAEAQWRDHLSVARELARPGWWPPDGPLPAMYTDYLRLERAASVVRSYGEQLLPRLIQTREYALSDVALDQPDDGVRARLVQMRMRRQATVFTPGGPTVWALVAEAALRHQPVGPAARTEQLRHLLALVEAGGLVLQVLPAAAAVRATGGPFTILRFAQHFLPDVVYLQQTTSSMRLEREADVEHYTLLMDRLVARAEQPRRTPEILRALLDE
jgi:transcriptional regulator with XRE-family HTH domain